MLTVDYRRLAVHRGDRLLDLGCGFGRHAYEAARLGAHVVAVDAAGSEVAEVRNTFAAMVVAGELDADSAQATAVQADALHLPFPDDSFDRIIASEVLEHIPSDEEAMAELARVLRPGGTIAITVPRLGPEFINWALSHEYHDTPGGHVRIYRHSTLTKRFEKAGLEEVGYHHAHGLHAPYWWLKCFVGTSRSDSRLVNGYHRLLVWDIVDRPWFTRLADMVLSPLVGKSLVVYLCKPDISNAGPQARPVRKLRGTGPSASSRVAQPGSPTASGSTRPVGGDRTTRARAPRSAPAPRKARAPRSVPATKRPVRPVDIARPTQNRQEDSA